MTGDEPAERFGATGGFGSDSAAGDDAGDDGLGAPPAICPGLPLPEPPDLDQFCVGWALEDGPPPCEAKIPPPPDGSAFDPDLIGVRFIPSSGSVEEIPPVASLDACSSAANGGVYLDAADGLLTVRVCPCTCARFGRDPLGQIEIVFACDISGLPE